MKFELESFHLDVSNSDLLADLKRVSEKLNKSKVTVNEYDQNGIYSSSTLKRRFGSWNKAIELTGLDKNIVFNASQEEILRNLLELWFSLKRQPRISDLTSRSSKFSAATYKRRFGSWQKALEAFVKWANDGEIESKLPESERKLKKHKTSRKINYRLRFLVMRRDNFKCRITGKSPATDPNVILEVDHIIPWDKGGETVLENLQTLAKEINIGKSNLDMFESE